VTAHERVLVRRPLRSETRCSQRVKAGDDWPAELRLYALGERVGVGARANAVLGEEELRCDRQHGLVADRISQFARSVERGLCVHGEDDEVGIDTRLRVRLADAIELTCGRACSLGVP